MNTFFFLIQVKQKYDTHQILAMKSVIGAKKIGEVETGRSSVAMQMNPGAGADSDGNIHWKYIKYI